MTSQEMIAAAVADPSVIAANSTQNAAGMLAPPNPGVLADRAKPQLHIGLGILLRKQAVARKVLERSATLTTVAGTSEYTFPTTVSRIINMRLGSNNRPIKVFESKNDHDLWYYNQYADQEITTSDPISRAYYSGRGAGNALKVTFSPGVGSETSIPYRYVRKMQVPYNAEDFPEEIHPFISIDLINRMSGGQMRAEVKEALALVRLFLQPITTGEAAMRYDDWIQTWVNSINSHYA